MGTEQTGLSGLAADSLDQPVYHDQRIRLAVRLGLEHGYRTVDSDDYGEGAGLPCYLENIHVFCQDACTETENRRDQQEISEAGRCDEETTGGDEPLQPVRCKPDGRLSADVVAVPDFDGIVHVCTERYRIASAEFLVGG